MSDSFELHAETRADVGKGASRRLRKTENIPAILYGAGKAPALLTLDHNKVIKALENPAFYSHILTLHVDGKAEKAILKAMQRHAFKPKVLHMDFLRINMNEKITMNVPLHFIHEDIAPGVVEGGGVISHVILNVEIQCLPGNLPEFLEVDLSKAELDHSLHFSDITLPAGVELVALTHGHNETIVTIHKPRVAEEPAETAAPVAAEVPATKVKDNNDSEKK